MFRIKEYYTNDDHVLSTPHVYEYLSRVMYHRRTKLDPLWNTFVVGGYNNGERYAYGIAKLLKLLDTFNLTLFDT